MTRQPNEFAQFYEEQLALQTNLPPLPQTVQKLLRLRNSKDGDVKELTKIINSDPLLAAQMVCYGQSSLFGYGSRIASTEQVVALVLGYEPALYMALGLSVGKSLRSPTDGVLGLEVLWRDAFYNAELCVELAKMMPIEQRPIIGLCHLSGLLHNIGFLLLGHLHPTHFRLINRQFEFDPTLDIKRVETMILGVSHDVSGMWISRAWNLPEEVVVAVSKHHDIGYKGQHAKYAWLVNIASHLLSDYAVSEMVTDSPPIALIEALGLTDDQIEEALAKVLEGQNELMNLANTMAA